MSCVMSRCELQLQLTCVSGTLLRTRHAKLAGHGGRRGTQRKKRKLGPGHNTAGHGGRRGTQRKRRKLGPGHNTAGQGGRRGTQRKRRKLGPGHNTRQGAPQCRCPKKRTSCNKPRAEAEPPTTTRAPEPTSAKQKGPHSPPAATKLVKTIITLTAAKRFVDRRALVQ